MKTILLAAALVLGAAPPAAAEPAPAKTLGQATARFAVDGMHCHGCADKIKAELGKHKGVASVAVDFDKKLFTVAFDPGKTSAKALEAVIVKLGYKAKLAA